MAERQCRWQRASNIATQPIIGAHSAAAKRMRMSQIGVGAATLGEFGICSVREEPSPEFKRHLAIRDTHILVVEAHSHGRQPVHRPAVGCHGTPWWCIP